MKLITVVGARPQFIKAAAVSRAIQDLNTSSGKQRLIERIVHTGQHYDENMSKVFFEELCIPTPFLNLQVGSASHGVQTGSMMIKLEQVFITEKPDAVIVYGDTNSTLAGALVASKLHIPVIHIESGLRSLNKRMPEEQNRVLTDHISTLLFCPTKTAIENLKREGFLVDTRIKSENNLIPDIDHPKAILSGDVMYDCVLYYGELAQSKIGILDNLKLVDKSGQIKPYVLATLHRPENTEDLERLGKIFSAFNQLTSDYTIVIPLHPRTRSVIDHSEELKNASKSIRFCSPLSYLEMILLEKNSLFICTDSGGVQKEAYFLDKPCITIRDQTEWTETVESGWNTLTSGDLSKISKAAKEALDWVHGSKTHAPFQPRLKKDSGLFGDGESAHMIVETIIESFK